MATKRQDEDQTEPQEATGKEAKLQELQRQIDELVAERERIKGEPD